MSDFRRSKNTAFQLSGQAVLGTATNPLLVKDDVGRAKPFTHALPAEQFAYGKMNQFTEDARDVIENYQYRDEAAKGKFSNPDIKDFKRLNKAVLREKATNAASNRVSRASYDLKLKQKQTRHASVRLPTEEHTYGRALRPQTPVEVVMANAFGEAASADLQNRYIAMKSFRPVTKCPTVIRPTNAQLHADQAVKQKMTHAEPRQLFKLQRFQNVEPRTSTKRGDQGYMVKQMRSTSSVT
mmetsp:Transcript_30468/g.37513  ORF Transcript_30468/g.37513 Transcript_30468/m.37513 type:complete len:240 (+) Transcript_30468:15-734(+)|eukprot:CAMPEP_0170466398 /NCGR_PEP_ID=MMETSP0123-20130129/10377_1 /TAXON_ID=182087 /ORGANISM="Favella ehrenbergii, Strain Fehren 1" /LENGTH=239 /DNA_ID=CAMNT_0010732525 /DNA_START=12 /DNA_END=731 /DNA_ORIENTATION=+